MSGSFLVTLKSKRAVDHLMDIRYTAAERMAELSEEASKLVEEASKIAAAHAKLKAEYEALQKDGAEAAIKIMQLQIAAVNAYADDSKLDAFFDLLPESDAIDLATEMEHEYVPLSARGKAPATSSPDGITFPD